MIRELTRLGVTFIQAERDEFNRRNDFPSKGLDISGHARWKSDLVGVKIPVNGFIEDGPDFHTSEAAHPSARACKKSVSEKS